LLESIFRAYSAENIDYKLEIGKTELDIEKAIPMGLILNELVNNSLKHAFEEVESGSIFVKIAEQNENISLEVKDNGKGIQNEKKTNSLGLQLVELLSEQLKGTFKIEQNNGTIVNILFPKYA